MAKLTQAEFDALSIEDQDKVPFSDLPFDDFEDGDEPQDTPNDDTNHDDDVDDYDDDNPDNDDDDDGEEDTDSDLDDADSDEDSDSDDESDEDAEEGEEGEEEQDPVKRAIAALSKDSPSKQTAVPKGGKAKAKNKEEAPAKKTPAAPALDPILRESYKINGKDVKIEDPKEIRRMVSRGIHLESRIAAMHGNAQLGAAIAKADIKAEDIGLLIDILAKKPEAIAKVVKDSGIDIDSLYNAEEKEYKPSALALPSEVESNFNLHATVHGHDQNYTFALNEASEWDEQSQTIIMQNPNVLNIMAQHKADGTFDKIAEVVTRKRTLEGDTRPIIAIYDEVGRAMFANKQTPAKAATTSTAKPKAKLPKRTRIVDTDLERKRKIVQGARGKTQNKIRQDIDALTVSDVQSMSQEDFDKIDPNKFFERN